MYQCWHAHNCHTFPFYCKFSGSPHRIYVFQLRLHRSLLFGKDHAAFSSACGGSQLDFRCTFRPGGLQPDLFRPLSPHKHPNSLKLHLPEPFTAWTVAFIRHAFLRLQAHSIHKSTLSRHEKCIRTARRH